MDRRTFLRRAVPAGGVLLLGGGFWAHQAYGRSKLRRELIRLANPLLTTKAHDELLNLPVRAREEMRRYFHGVCLNVHDFVAEICSPPFAERLAECTAPAQQQEQVLLAFMRQVVTETQVLNKVQLIAEDISHDLDRNWATCCGELANKWDLSIKEYRTTVTATELTDRATPLVQNGIRQALARARSATQRPALGEMAGDVGKAALLLLPVAAAAPWIGWPLFAVLALKPVITYFVDQVRDRSRELQWAVSEKLAYLGNQMGAEFENEVRLRIADLHKWQDQAVEKAAQQQAEQLIRLL
jgi:hypothetical protein